MGCAFDKELLTGYYDGELDAAEKARVERHIAGCSECLRDLGEIRSASQLVRKLAGPRMPQEVSERIARAIEEERRRRFRGRWRRGLTGSLAVAAGIFLALNVAYFLRLESGGKPSDLAPAIGVAGVPEADEAERAKAREAKAEPAPARRKALQGEPQAPEGFTDGRGLAQKAAGEEQKYKSSSSEAPVGTSREKAVDRADKPVPAAAPPAAPPREAPKAPPPPPPPPPA
ncbi:MAG: anti-sigma factor family protein, partial [Planctomycetota bacterium]